MKIQNEFIKYFLLIASVIVIAPGCVVVGGYSSGRGFWIWPGTFVIIALVLLFLLMRRR